MTNNPNETWVLTHPTTGPIIESRGRLDQRMRYFLSAADALIEAASMLRIFNVVSIRSVISYTVPFPKMTLPYMHIAWKARESKVILRDAGLPDPLMIRSGKRFWGKNLQIEPDKEAFAAFNCVRELAGLYAWEETGRSMASWHPCRRDAVFDNAWKSAPVCMREAGNAFNQLAVFDPEFAQWHFVAVSDLRARGHNI